MTYWGVPYCRSKQRLLYYICWHSWDYFAVAVFTNYHFQQAKGTRLSRWPTSPILAPISMLRYIAHYHEFWTIAMSFGKIPAAIWRFLFFYFFQNELFTFWNESIRNSKRIAKSLNLGNINYWTSFSHSVIHVTFKSFWQSCIVILTFIWGHKSSY